MKKFSLALATFISVAHVFVCLAADPALVDSTITHLDPLRVTASGLPWGDSALRNADLRDRRGANLAENLELLPGVAAVRRAASAAELVIRGLGWERVQTVLGAVPLYGACPGRMDPPATYLGALSSEQVSVFRQGGGASIGPGAIGGAVVAKPDFEREPGAGTGWSPWLAAGYESARDGFRYEGGLFGGTEKMDLKFSAGRSQNEDYTAPDGTVVPAGQTTATAGGSLGWRPRAGQHLFYAGTYTREENVDFPALPMDNIETDFWVHNVGWRTERPDGLVRRVEVTGGASVVDHLMDNSLKPNRGLMEAATDARTRSTAAHVVFDLRPTANCRLRVGLDATRLTRDATRTRLIVASGATYQDRLWPDAVQRSVGSFAQLTRQLMPALSLTLNGRLDAVDSEARAADAPSLGGRTVREQYVAYYGADAGRTDRTETLGQVRLGLQGEFSPRAQWRARLGLSTRPGGITERFYAFGPAPGGFQVGDPTLSAEHKQEGEIGLSVTGDHFVFSVSGFQASVSNFILPTVIDRRDVNGDSIEDTIKGFANVDATLTGGELGLELHPLPTVYVPVTVSVVRGHNTTADRDLPEIPPLFGTAEIRWRASMAAETWLRGGCSFAAAQDRVDQLFPEDRTGGHAIWHLGLDSALPNGWRLGLRVDNLLDRQYNDHLTREAVLPTGGLAAGQEIPAPGRSFAVNVRLEF